MAVYNKHIGKYVVIWNVIPNNMYNNRSFGYPKYVINKDGSLAYIDEIDFPEKGAIQFIYAGNTSADEVYEEFGEIFIAKINGLDENNNIESDNRLIGRINLDFIDGQIDLYHLKEFGFKQVIEINEPIETIREKGKISSIQSYYTREIMLKYGNKYYGPFERNKTDINDIYTIEALAENEYNVGEFNEEDIDPFIAEVGNQYEELVATFISDYHKDIITNASRKIDFASKTVLKDNLNTIISYNKSKAHELTREQIREISDIVSFAYETRQTAYLTEYRKDKILEMIDSVSELDDFVGDVVKCIISNEERKNEVANYILENKIDVLKNNPVIEDWINTHSRNNDIHNSSTDTFVSDLKKEIVLLKRKNAVLEMDLKNQKEINQHTQPEEILKNIDRLKKEEIIYQEKVKTTRDDYHRWIKYKDEVENELKELIGNYSNEAKLIAKNADNYLMKDILGIITGTSKEERVLEKYDESVIDVFSTGEEIIERVLDFIENEANRVLTREDVVNLLVCVSNGFLTTFAGQPGTGKTSICTLLAKALGLAGKENNRFVPVAVERGWTSNKDYIGYYNPLTNKYEKSNIEMFNAVSRLDCEAKGDKFDAPYLVLLDEANLSPIEHYWSCFNRICDLDADNRHISLGGDYLWEVSNNLRFLATINFDHTTEELSPRFLDRTWLIMLKPTNIDFQYMDKKVENLNTIVSMNDLMKYFTPQENDNVDEIIKAKWTRIQEIFNSVKVLISPRNIKMIRNYCIAASKYMNPLTALDYAVSQKLLPIINGSGKQYDELITSLEREFEDSMPRCYEMIKKIKVNAEENFGSYQLF